jgi:hypothetical protein
MNRIITCALPIALSVLLGGAAGRAAELVLDDLSGGVTAWGGQAALTPVPGAAGRQGLRWALDETPRLGRDVAVQGSGWRTLKVRLFSERMTGDRVRLTLHAPNADNRYELVFSVDWQGENDLQIEPYCGTAVGQPRGFDALTRIELERVDTQFGGSVLFVQSLGLSTDSAIHPAGPNLDILDASYSGTFRDLAAWQPVPADSTPGTAMRCRPYWCWLEFTYAEQPAGSQHAVFERPLLADVSAYDQLVWHVSGSAGRYATLWAKVDGAWVHGEEKRPGVDGFADLTVPIAGKRLEAVRLEAGELPGARRAEAGHEIITILQWIVAHRRGSPPFGPVWRPATHDAKPRQPTEEALTAGVPFGFYFTRDEIPALRERIKSGPPAAMWENIRKQADAVLSAEPEKYVDEFTHPSMAEFTPASEPSIPYSSWITAPALAYVLTGEPRYADIARRGILTVCQVDWWGRGLPARYPFGFSGTLGSQLNQSWTAMYVLQGYDWVYNTFTEAERQLVRDAIRDKVYYWMWQSGTRYRDFSNRGAVYSWMFLQSAAVLGEQAPALAVAKAANLEFLDALVRGYFGRDGAGREGVGYGMGTLGLLQNIACAVAAERKLPVAEYVADTSLRQALEWFLWMRGTATAPASFLNYSDAHYSSFAIGSPQALFYSHFFRDGQAQWVWEQQHGAKPPGDVRTLVWYRPEVKAQPEALGLSKLFRGDGFLFWRNGWQYGDTLFAFTGGPATRSGGDRNQFVLEAYGERLLLDPGICGYADPEANLFHLSTRHNVITFNDEDQHHRDAKQAAVTTEFLAGDAIEFAESDATLAYASAKRVVRTMAFVRPDVFVISDIAESAEPAKIALNLNFGAPVRLEDEGRTLLAEGPHGRLRAVLLAPAAVEAEQHTFRTDTASVPDHHLALSPPGKVAATQFVSLLLPSPSRLPESARIERLVCTGGYAATVTDGERREVILVAAPGATESVKTGGMEASARMAVISRQSGKVRALAMLNGTRLWHHESLSVYATAPVTLSVSYREDGRLAICRARGPAGTTLHIPLAGPQAWALTPAQTLVPITVRLNADGTAGFALPPPATPYDEAVVVFGTAAPPVTAAAPTITRLTVDGQETPPGPDITAVCEGELPRELAIEVACQGAALDRGSLRVLADGVPVPPGSALKWEPLAADGSRVRVTCQLAAHLQVTPGVVAGHTVTFQLANSALFPQRAECTLNLGAKVAARPGVTYLSDATPLESFAHGGVTSDHGYWAPAAPLKLNGVIYAKGVGMHPETGRNAMAVYDASAWQDKTLQAAVGINDGAGGGSAVFIVQLQTKGGAWREAYRSPPVALGQPPVAVAVPLGDADRLRLEVNDAGDGISCDHAVWAEARITAPGREGAAETR